MAKKIEDLTKKEWDTLFPIELVDRNPDWGRIYEREKLKIEEKIGDRIIRIEHVGSTAIPHIRAKPYIDITIEISKADLFSQQLIAGLTNLGYHFFRQVGKGIDYMVFVKGYDLTGKKEQIFHVHMCPSGHEMLNQITFRDFLRKNPGRAREYEQLKIGLASKFKNDRVGYRVAKDGFIADTINMSEKTGSL